MDIVFVIKDYRSSPFANIRLVLSITGDYIFVLVLIIEWATVSWQSVRDRYVRSIQTLPLPRPTLRSIT